MEPSEFRARRFSWNDLQDAKQDIKAALSGTPYCASDIFVAEHPIEGWDAVLAATLTPPPAYSHLLWYEESHCEFLMNFARENLPETMMVLDMVLKVKVTECCFNQDGYACVGIKLY